MTADSRTTPPLSPAQLAAALVAGVILGSTKGRDGTLTRLTKLGAAALLTAMFAPRAAGKLVRAGAARRRVRLRTTLILDKPVREVFDFCHDFENFQRIIQSLRRVVDYQDGRSHWEVISPGGEVLAWDAEVTKYVPNAVIAWRSVAGSVVDCKGLIRFGPAPNGRTRLQIEIDYDPGHTGFSDAIHALVDVPRQDQLNADLARANFYLRAQPRAVRSPEPAGAESPSSRSA